ncbi:MAG: carboxypeptidase regulatory-like domain-containing protein, partial [Candidatus Eremiobacteraeota bacterium]|nr:carboxypeptidase regulatory-like domain-containing protein [Candidatus Eremiobacteraeota bacterium]
MMRKALFSAMLFALLAGPATAGTTGRLNGTATDAKSGAALSGVRITAVSPSQSVAAATGNAGRFSFISLSPDTYTISAQKTGYDSQSSIVVVQADQAITANFALQPSLKTIGTVISRASNALVKPGTISDVYTVSAAQQQRLAAMGGGGGLNIAYSAIRSVPGIYVPPNQTGFFQILHIRGGDYDQTGYEL